MNDRLTDVINACMSKKRIVEPSDIPVLTLLTRSNLTQSDIGTIRDFQTVIHERLGIELHVIGGGYGCTAITVTVRTDSAEHAKKILHALFSLDIFREEARKAGFFSAFSADLRLDLINDQVEHTHSSAPGLAAFVSYSYKDDSHVAELENHLCSLRYKGMISLWHRKKITAGSGWAAQVDSQIRNADIILALISSDFLASDYCFGTEMQTALIRHKQSEARVIPIIVRAVDWADSDLSRLMMLPKNGSPITSWKNLDEACGRRCGVHTKCCSRDSDTEIANVHDQRERLICNSLTTFFKPRSTSRHAVSRSNQALTGRPSFGSA